MLTICPPPLSQFIEEQAIDRVHRLTQTVDVVVYKLTVRDTVEERILELQEKKRLLAMHAIEGGLNKKNKESLKLSLQDLLNLFKPRGNGSGPNGDRDPFEDDEHRFYGFSQKESDVARSVHELLRKKPKEGSGGRRREDDVYGRRW